MITPIGYFTIAVIFISFYLTIRINKRLNDKGCFAYGYIFLLVFSIISIFLSSSYMSFQSLYIYVAGENYEGKIIDYKSYEKEDKDSNDDYRNKSSTVYISIIEFVDKDNEKIQLESNIHSGTIPNVGGKISIFYLKGQTTVSEESIASFMLLLIGLAFTIFFGFFSVGIFKYGFGYSMLSFKEQFVIGFYTAVKVSFFLFAFSFILPIYNYLVGKSDMPFWVFILCSVSFFTLIFSFYKLVYYRN